MHIYKVPLVLTRQPEGGYTVTSPMLPELVTEGDTIDEAWLCRKFAFEPICTIVSPGDLRCTERENDDGDQFQGSPFSAGY